MKKNELEKKELLSKELDMNFEEAMELFSEESLTTMKMTEVGGGEAGLNIYGCNGKVFCTIKTYCPCTVNAKTCLNYSNCANFC